MTEIEQKLQEIENSWIPAYDPRQDIPALVQALREARKFVAISHRQGYDWKIAKILSRTSK